MELSTYKKAQDLQETIDKCESSLASFNSLYELIADFNEGGPSYDQGAKKDGGTFLSSLLKKPVKYLEKLTYALVFHVISTGVDRDEEVAAVVNSKMSGIDPEKDMLEYLEIVILAFKQTVENKLEEAKKEFESL